VHDRTPTYWGFGMIEICSLDPARGERLLLGFKPVISKSHGTNQD